MVPEVYPGALPELPGEATTGTVIVEDQDLSTLSEAELRKVRTGIAMIFQHFNLLNAEISTGKCVFSDVIIQGKKKKESKRKSGRTSGNRRIEGKSKCISFSIIRWSKTEIINSKSIS